MTANNTYRVTEEIKLHTKPLRTAQIIKEGAFVKETSKSFIFDGFRVQKRCVVAIEEKNEK